MSREVQIRERSVDYIQTAKNVVESYPSGLAHGLQKDAIQNGWDACIHKTKASVQRDWGVTFELVERKGKRNMLIVEDRGTSGLTGNMIADDVEDGVDLPEEERWARWEMLSAGKGDSASLGQRGQGKMLLIASSGSHEIFYDSLRSDGSYRMGWTQARHTGCPLYMQEGADGRKKIEDELGLKAISHIGTRFIIMDPIDEVVDSIKDGTFMLAIEETWWPIILKFGAKISVIETVNNKTAGVPDGYPIADDGHHKMLKNDARLAFNRTDYRVKHLAIAYSPDPLPHLHRGVSVFRGGMKVTVIDFPIRSHRDKVYGYVELDSPLDEKLKEVELPNHYQFRNTGVWVRVKDYIEEEMEAFGAQRLGLGIDAREKEKRKRTEAQTKAMEILRAITKDWPFSSIVSGTLPPGPTPPPPPPPTPLKEIGIKISELAFPNGANMPRLDYDQELKGFNATVFNRTGDKVSLLFRAAILAGSTEVLELDSKKIILDRESETLTEDQYAFKVTKEIFPEPGIYRIKFSLRLDDGTKTELDEVTRRFWVEADPDLNGPFDVEFIDFSEIPDPPVPPTAQFYLFAQGGNRHKLYCNTGHPTYKQNESSEFQPRYLGEIYAMAALELMVKQVITGEVNIEGKEQSLPFDPKAITSDDAREVYKEMTLAMSAVRFKIDSSF